MISRVPAQRFRRAGWSRNHVGYNRIGKAERKQIWRAEPWLGSTSSLAGGRCDLGAGRLEDDLYSTTAAPGAFQTALQKIEREAFASRPNQRLHVELDYHPADVRPAAVA